MHDDLAAKIAAIEAMRSVIGDAAADAAIAALRAAPPPPATHQELRAETASGNLQLTAGNDALVLRDITIAEGGTLIVGGEPVDLPPAPPLACAPPPRRSPASTRQQSSSPAPMIWRRPRPTRCATASPTACSRTVPASLPCSALCATAAASRPCATPRLMTAISRM
jgi:hypothetical protein